MKKQTAWTITTLALAISIAIAAPKKKIETGPATTPTPEPISNVASTRVSCDENAASENVTLYRFFISNADGPATSHLDCAPPSPAVVFTNLQPGATYKFTAIAINAQNIASDPSAEISYTVPSKPSAPTNLHVTEPATINISVTR